MTGIKANESEAKIAFQLVTYCPIYCCIPKITVCLPFEGAKIKGHQRSFQTGTIVNTPTVAIGGLSSGNTI